MSLLLMEGFDDGLWNKGRWTGYVGSVNKTGRDGTANGAWSPQYNTHGLYYDFAADEDDEMWVGIAVYFGNAEGGDIIRFNEGGTTHMALQRSGGDMRLCRGTNGATVLCTASSVISEGVWAYWEAYVKISDTIGVATIYKNGTQVATATGLDTKDGGTDGLIDRISFGPNTNDMSFDDIYICNSAGTAPTNTFLGDVRVETRYPNGNGDTNQWVGSDANSTDNYLLVDETGDPDSADYSGSGTSTEIDLYAFTNLTVSAATIFGVDVSLYAAKSDAGAASVKPEIRSNGANYEGASQSPSTSYGYIGEIWEKDPDGNVAWTVSSVNAAQFGAEVA